MAANLPLNRAGARASARLFGFWAPLVFCAIASLTTSAAPALAASPTAPLMRAVVPVQQLDAGTWPSAFGQQWGGPYAGETQPAYWRGFQRRWAAGLELHHKRAGE